MKHDDVAIVTYTNSKYADVLKVHLAQLDRHAPNIKSYVFVDDPELKTLGSERHVFVVYDKDAPYYLQWTSCLERVTEPFVVYSQEDFILYDDVDLNSLQRYKEFLLRSPHSFVRLIRANFDETLRQVEDDLYEVNRDNEDIFHMQATLWKKDDVRRLYLEAKSDKWLEGPHWRDKARELGTRGVFVYRGESKRGKYHYDSSVWPYFCTSVSRGKWNFLEYEGALRPMLVSYGIDPTIRGIRSSYNYG